MRRQPPLCLPSWLGQVLCGEQELAEQLGALLWPPLAAAYIAAKLKPIAPQSDAEASARHQGGGRWAWRGSAAAGISAARHAWRGVGRCSDACPFLPCPLPAGASLQPQVSTGGQAGAEGRGAAPPVGCVGPGVAPELLVQDGFRAGIGGRACEACRMCLYRRRCVLCSAGEREGPITRHIKHTLNRFLNARRNRCAAAAVAPAGAPVLSFLPRPCLLHCAAAAAAAGLRRVPIPSAPATAQVYRRGARSAALLGGAGSGHCGRAAPRPAARRLPLAVCRRQPQQQPGWHAHGRGSGGQQQQRRRARR